MIIALQWVYDPVALAALIAAGYDEQQVQGGGPAWVNILRDDQRLPLLADVERYCFEVGGATVGTYRVVPTRASDDATDTPVTITAAAPWGYCTVADVRAEGYAALAYPDDRVQDAIAQATANIEAACGQRFAPHRRRVTLDVSSGVDEIFLDEPCCALWQVWDGEDTSVDRADLYLYNRHLTEGWGAPDDRGNPRVALRSGSYDPLSWWTSGRRQLLLDGVWGYTELDGAPGETSRGSQVPLSYGVTPAAIRRACLLLTVNLLATLADGGGTPDVSARVISETTRDQSYTLQPLPTAAIGYGATGNATVDGLLRPFHAPLRMGVI